MSRAAAGARRRWQAAGGFTMIELLVVLAIAAIVLAIAAPLTANVKDASRVRHAAGFAATRFRAARQQAVAQERSVALVFDLVGADWTFRVCADGNGNGVRRAEIGTGTDDCAEGPYLFSALYPTVEVAVDPALPGPDGTEGTSDPVKFGVSDIASFSPTGSCTAGSLYLRSAHGTQYAIRVSGITGRTRILRFDPATSTWKVA